MKGVMVEFPSKGKECDVRLAEDPFPVTVLKSQVRTDNGLRTMPIRTRHSSNRKETRMAKATTKELRKQAQNLGIEDWEELDKEGLAAAIAEAEDEDVPDAAAGKVKKGKKGKAKSGKTAKATKEKTKSTKTKKTRAPREARKPAANGNPFRPESQMFIIAELLIQGGTGKELVKALKKNKDIEFKDREGTVKTADSDYLWYLRNTAKILEKNHNFKVKMEGRGLDKTFKVSKPKKNAA